MERKYIAVEGYRGREEMEQQWMAKNDGWCLITLVCFSEEKKENPSSFGISLVNSRLTKVMRIREHYANLLIYLSIVSSVVEHSLSSTYRIDARKPFLMNRIRFIRRYRWSVSEENLFDIRA